MLTRLPLEDLIRKSKSLLNLKKLESLDFLNTAAIILQPYINSDQDQTVWIHLVYFLSTKLLFCIKSADFPNESF